MTVRSGLGEGRGVVTAALVVLFLWAALRLVFFSGFQAHDDRNYVFYALMFAQTGEPNTGHVTAWLGRIGAWLPLVVPLSKWPSTTVLHAWYSLVCSLGTVALTAWAAWQVTRSRYVVLLAALLVVTYPLDILFSTTMYTDIPHGFWGALGVLAFWQACKTSGESGRWALLAGAGIGVSWLQKETAVLLVPALLYLWAYYGFRLRPALLGAAACLGVLLAESMFWLAYTGDPLYRFATILSERAEAGFTTAKSKSLFEIWMSHGKRPVPRIVEPIVMALTQQEFALHFVAALVASTVVLRRREANDLRPLALAAILVVGAIAYLPVMWPLPLACNPRYYTPSTPLLMPVLAVGLARLSPLFRRLVLTLLLFAASVCVFVDGGRVQLVNDSLLLEWMQRARAHGNVTVWVDPSTFWRLWYVNGCSVPEGARIHLLTATERAHSYREARIAWPSLPVWGNPENPPEGIVAIRRPERIEQFAKENSCCSLVTVLQASRSGPTESVRRFIAALPFFSSLADRLQPSEGESIGLFRCVPENSPSSPDARSDR